MPQITLDMSDKDFRSLQQDLSTMGTSIKEILELLKGDKFDNPGLVSKVNLQEQQIVMLKQTIADLKIDALKSENLAEKKLAQVKNEVSRIYWTASGISLTIASIISLIALFKG